MCWSIDTPQVTTSTSVPASTLVPETISKTPESPELGGTEDTFNKKKGRQQLTIQRNGLFNPTSM